MNKKGQSLVEVVVALGILAFVFAGTITLIVQVVSLQLSARNKTEAVALAQKQLAIAISDIGDGCTAGALTNPNGTVTEGSVPYSYTVTTSDSPDYTNGLDATNFTEITVVVSWDNRDIKDNSYTLKQVVPK